MTSLPRALLAACAASAGLVLGACGGEAPADDGAAASPPAQEETSPPAEDGATASPPADAPDEREAAESPSAEEPAGDPAPDFTLALADGGEFTLSKAERPVYLIFWAEW